MIGSLLSFFLIGLIAIVAASIVLSLVGLVFSIAWALAKFLLFYMLPIVLVGYVIVRLLAPRERRR